MKSKPQKKWLSNQEYQRERKRLTRRYIFEALAELEEYPGYQRGYGFPFDMLANGIGKSLDGLESVADKIALKMLTKLKDHNKSSKR
jgi:hypothetical protein